jgi:myosin heavy subunit
MYTDTNSPRIPVPKRLPVETLIPSFDQYLKKKRKNETKVINEDDSELHHHHHHHYHIKPTGSPEKVSHARAYANVEPTRSFENEEPAKPSEDEYRKLSLSGLSLSTNNSKAVIAALKSLQKKIKSLEQERDKYKHDLESERTNANDIKRDLEQRLGIQKTQLLTEKEAVESDRRDIENRLIRVQEQLKSLQRENDELRDIKLRMEQESSQHQAKIMELDRTCHSTHQQNLTMEENYSKMVEQYNQAQNKIDELQKSLVKEHRKAERLEETNRQLDKTMQDMIAIQRELVSRVSRSSGSEKSVKSYRSSEKEKISPRNSTRSLSAGKVEGTQKQRRLREEDVQLFDEENGVTKKRKKKSTTRSTSTTRSRSANTVKKKRSVSADRRRLRIGSPTGTIHDRLKRAYDHELPFLSGNTENSFHITAAAQKNLHVGTEFEKRKSEEPYNYYGSNTLEPQQFKMIEEIGADNSSEELDSVLKTLELEYEQLNRKYHDMLERKNNNDNSSIVIDTEELRELLDVMDKKAKQLSVLRQYRTSVGKRIRMATSPPRIRGAKKRVKTLRLFNHLRKLSQTS